MVGADAELFARIEPLLRYMGNSALVALGATALSLVWPDTGDNFPASVGGLAGIVGEKAIRGLAALLPAGQGWAIFALGLLTLVGGAILAGRVFAIDWAGLFSIPRSIASAPAMIREEGLSLPKLKKARAEKARRDLDGAKRE